MSLFALKAAIHFRVGRGRNPLAGVRLLPPAGYAVVGALLRCPLPLDLLRSLLVVSPSFPIRRFPVPSLRTFDG